MQGFVSSGSNLLTLFAMSKVLNFGSINIDETFEVPHLCQKGETLSSVGYTIRGGGKGKQNTTSLGSQASTRLGSQLLTATSLSRLKSISCAWKGTI
jgi:hypothetical protein